MLVDMGLHNEEKGEEDFFSSCSYCREHVEEEDDANVPEVNSINFRSSLEFHNHNATSSISKMIKIHKKKMKRI